VARETKIGLVVGLGFIVCFAIILSNRGAAHTPNVTYLYRPDLDVTRSPAPATAAEPERRARALASNSPSREREPSANRRAEERPARNPEVGSAPPMTRGTDLRSDPSRAAAAPSETSMSASANPQPETSGPLALRNAPLAELNPAARTSGDPAPALAAKESSPISGCKHTVARGDTLWKIAETYYGARSSQIVDAIFEANRGTLSGPERLVLGQELVLPVLSGFQPPALRQTATIETSSPPAEIVPSATETQKPPGAKPPKTIRNRTEMPRMRLYEVKPGDRYASIAQSQLGDRNRWKEIYELNKDQIPDPTKIRTGTKIRLPDHEG
jgi:nucleoid-associated protein YgaU